MPIKMEYNNFVCSLIIKVILLFSVCAIHAELSTICQQKDCPVGFTLYEPSCKCYIPSNIIMNEAEHAAHCSRLAVGATIADPRDSGEDDFIRELMKSQEASDKENCMQVNENCIKFFSYLVGVESTEQEATDPLDYSAMFRYRPQQTVVYDTFRPDEPYCMRGEKHLPIFDPESSKENAKFCSVCELRLLK